MSGDRKRGTRDRVIQRDTLTAREREREREREIGRERERERDHQNLFSILQTLTAVVPLGEERTLSSEY